jgi:hypothetical protein
MNTNKLATKKITLTTVKSFIKANCDKLYINVTSSFDGMTDMCEQRYDGFKKVTTFTADHREHTRGIAGAWFVGESRDYFSFYSKDGFEGIQVSNSCGRFILAIKTSGEFR